MPKQGIPIMAIDARTRSIVALANQLRALYVCSERIPCHVVVLPEGIVYPFCVVFPFSVVRKNWRMEMFTLFP